jgi:hypothetical protein
MHWHYKNGDLDYGTGLVALLLGPILAIFIGLQKSEVKKNRKIHEETERNDRHRRWFQTMGLINRNTIPGYGRTIPPPPPISRIERARRERDGAIRSALERIEPPNRRFDNKSFKFFRG